MPLLQHIAKTKSHPHITKNKNTVHKQTHTSELPLSAFSLCKFSLIIRDISDCWYTWMQLRGSKERIHKQADELCIWRGYKSGMIYSFFCFSCERRVQTHRYEESCSKACSIDIKWIKEENFFYVCALPVFIAFMSAFQSEDYGFIWISVTMLFTQRA